MNIEHIILAASCSACACYSPEEARGYWVGSLTEEGTSVSHSASLYIDAEERGLLEVGGNAYLGPMDFQAFGFAILAHKTFEHATFSSAKIEEGVLKADVKLPLVDDDLVYHGLFEQVSGQVAPLPDPFVFPPVPGVGGGMEGPVVGVRVQGARRSYDAGKLRAELRQFNGVNLKEVYSAARDGVDKLSGFKVVVEESPRRFSTRAKKIKAGGSEVYEVVYAVLWTGDSRRKLELFVGNIRARIGSHNWKEGPDSSREEDCLTAIEKALLPDG